MARLTIYLLATVGGTLRRGAFAAVLLSAVITSATAAAQAQTFTTLYNFAYGADGETPSAGLSTDRVGNLYGTAAFGGYTSGQCGSNGCGTVFQLAHGISGWTFNLLYSFAGPDGEGPASRVIFGPDGDLYGTTSYGGEYGQGTVFRLRPPAHECGSALCPWNETVLHSFSGGSSDGANPISGDLTFDRAGNIYGTTSEGGGYASGTVYELSPSQGGWTESILYSFKGNDDGQLPWAGVIFDSSGNLYGTTVGGGANGGCDDGASHCGTVYKLTHSASRWTESILYSFSLSGSAGYYPLGGLIFDSVGNLYGITWEGGQNGAGAAYEVTPSNGGWTLSVLYRFSGMAGSYAAMTLDTAGNLYGTIGNHVEPEVFRLTQTNGQWMLTGFNGSAGAAPTGSVILDTDGNIYTTAQAGGLYGGGVVFEITP